MYGAVNIEKAQQEKFCLSGQSFSVEDLLKYSFVSSPQS